MQCQAHAYGVASCGNQRPVKTTLTRIRFRAILGRFLVFYILFTATLVLRQFVYYSLHQQQLQAVCSMPTATAFRAFLHCGCPALYISHYKRTNSPQAVAAVREEDLTLLGVLPGHARRMLLRLPSLRAAAVPVDGGAAAAENPASTASASAIRLS